MVVTINNQEYRIREEMPGVIQLVATDAAGRIVSTLEATQEVVTESYGVEVCRAVSNYLESFDHLCQLAVDYGYTIDTLTAGHARLKRHIPGDVKRKLEYLGITQFTLVFWQHYLDGQQIDAQGVGSADLWKLLNK